MMTATLHLIFLITVSVNAYAVLSSDSTLRFVTALWRHGDRAPADPTFPTDTGNGDSTWPQGYGELSELGMRQHQHLGQYLQQRYVIDDGFLSPNYSTKEVYIRSTSYNRTIMSALSNLAGMYPTPNGVDYLQGIPYWQPIPVHSQPREADPMLWMDCPCPKEEEIYQNDVLKSSEVNQIEMENKDFLDFLLNKTGKPTMSLDDVWDAWDPLNCERIHNDTHKWPAWVNDTVFDQMTNLSMLSTTFYYHDPRLQRFRGSMLYNEIATRLDQKAHRPDEIQPPQMKYYIYSAHDTTIMALLENLGAYNGWLPEYASALLFELHERQKGVFTVETWYVNETMSTMPPVRITVKGCDDQGSGDCKLETFVKLAGSNVPTDWWEECKLTPKNGTTTSNPSTANPDVQPDCNAAKQPATIAAIVLGVTTGIFMVAFIIVLIMYCRVTKRLKTAHRSY